MNKKIITEGELLVLIENDEDNVPNICAEIAGIDIWKWIEEHNRMNVRITLEELE